MKITKKLVKNIIKEINPFFFTLLLILVFRIIFIDHNIALGITTFVSLLSLDIYLDYKIVISEEPEKNEDV